MQLPKLNARGFTHYVALVGVVIVAVVTSVFVAVLNHHNSSAKSNITAPSSSSHKKSTLSASQKTQAPLPAANSTAPPTTSAAKPTTTAAKTTSSSPKSSPATPAPAPSPAPAPAPSQTALSVLTTLINNLDNGAQVNVTTSAVTVPGPISNATARPIVFTANGQVYFAYRQGSPANFTTSASQTANSMAIVNATVSNSSLEQAHLDKAANLVDPNISGYLVGYSQGGN